MSRWKGKKNPWLELKEREKRTKAAKEKQILADKAEKLAIYKEKKAIRDRELELKEKSKPVKTNLFSTRKPTETAPIDKIQEEALAEAMTEDYVWDIIGGEASDTHISQEQKFARKQMKNLMFTKSRRAGASIGKGIMEQIEAAHDTSTQEK